ncbi:hypothetical protein O181_127741 [Austropuccinia psidii MF-1]|uniref:Uncharacterized protein n=1 Tax=Austropuccinia psidii MF-1 TaxID=1389203 RepID=A0A9Q3KXL0_9BASI|nr:hypothetical protein [Austropuccinia psidii MF-1]
MGPGHVGEIWVHGASNRPHGLWTTAYGPWPTDRCVWPPDHRTPKKKKRPKRTIEPKTPIFTQDPKKAEKAIEARIFKIYLSKGQGPKTMVRPGEGISKTNGDKTP